MLFKLQPLPSSPKMPSSKAKTRCCRPETQKYSGFRRSWRAETLTPRLGLHLHALQLLLHRSLMLLLLLTLPLPQALSPRSNCR
jgi:hypothetical protein